MKLEELLDTERKEGIAEGMAEGMAKGIAKSKAEYIMKVLSARGKVSDSLKVRLCAITDVNQLDELFESALGAESVEAFEKLIQNL